MTPTLTLPKNQVLVSRDELNHYKKVNSIFQDVLDYFEHISDIKEAREEIKKGKVISQKDLFKELKL